MPGTWVREHKREMWLGLIPLLSLALRLASLRSFLAIDEQLRALRARRLTEALRAGDLTRTYQARYPGVVAMWLGAASIRRGTANEGERRPAFDVREERIVGDRVLLGRPIVVGPSPSVIGRLPVLSTDADL